MKILVTGATGLIGSIIVKSLLAYSKENKAHIKMYACCRNIEKFKKVFSECLEDNLNPICADITNLDISKLDVDYIIHGASITDSKTFVDKPVETINTAIDGTRNLLDQCIGKQLKGVVYLSSLEVYGTFDNGDKITNVTENKSGYIDTMNVRSSYSMSKRMVETMCKSYQNEYNIPVKVVRLSQTFGAGVDYNDNRVFAQFARAVIENKDIVLKTKGETVRNYCYTTDAVSGILIVLSKGTVGEVYNIANMNTTISIVDLAKKICDLFPESKSKVAFDIAEDACKLGYNPVVKIQLDSTKLIELGWQAQICLDDMLKWLVESMKLQRKL